MKSLLRYFAVLIVHTFLIIACCIGTVHFLYTPSGYKYEFMVLETRSAIAFMTFISILMAILWFLWTNHFCHFSYKKLLNSYKKQISFGESSLHITISNKIGQVFRLILLFILVSYISGIWLSVYFPLSLGLSNFLLDLQFDQISILSLLMQRQLDPSTIMVAVQNIAHQILVFSVCCFTLHLFLAARPAAINAKTVTA